MVLVIRLNDKFVLFFCVFTLVFCHFVSFEALASILQHCYKE